jgi:hypothetical protein
VHLFWERPPAEDDDDKPTGYVVKVKQCGSSAESEDEIVKVTGDTFTTIDGLNSNTKYIFQVSAKNAAGNGPPTSKRHRTAQIGKVAD